VAQSTFEIAVVAVISAKPAKLVPTRVRDWPLLVGPFAPNAGSIPESTGLLYVNVAHLVAMSVGD